MSAHESNYGHTQRLRDTIFEIADGGQCGNAAAAVGRCSIFNGLHVKLTAVTFRTCVGERNIYNAGVAFNPWGVASTQSTRRFPFASMSFRHPRSVILDEGVFA